MKMLAFKRWYSIFIYKSLEIHWSLKAYWMQILFNTTSKFHAKKINVSILYAKMLHNFTYLFDNTLNFKFINTYILRGIYFLNDVDRNDNIIQLSKGRFTRHNFVACDMLTTSLGHELFPVNQTYNLLTTVVYDTKNVVGFWNMF